MIGSGEKNKSRIKIGLISDFFFSI